MKMEKQEESNENTEKKEKIVLVSGGFDPLHLGHLLSFQAAKRLGDKLIVVIDGDEYLIKKKGAVFMPIEDRIAIIRELRCVDDVIVMGDGDLSETILYMKPDIFANGGDRSNLERIPITEREACEKVGCKIIFNVGGGNKLRSSSDLLKKWVDHERQKENKY